MNEAIGRIPCPLCGKESHVKKFAKGKREGELYIHCPKHGPFMNPGRDMQEWIISNAGMNGPNGEPSPPAIVAVASAPEPETSAPLPDPAAAPERAPVPAPKRLVGSFLPLFG